MTIYIVHVVEAYDSDTGHDVYYKSHISKIFKNKSKAERFIEDNGGSITKKVIS